MGDTPSGIVRLTVLGLVFLGSVLGQEIAGTPDDILRRSRAYWLATNYGTSVEAVLENEDMTWRLREGEDNAPLNAPLLDRATLEYALPYVKLVTAANSDFGLFNGAINAEVNPESDSGAQAAAPAPSGSSIPPGFGAWAKIFGIYDDIAAVEVLTTFVPGHDGLGGWGEECTQANGSVYGAATAYMVTYKATPGKLGFFWRGTEAFSLRSYGETLCWWQVALEPENGGPCPPGPDGEPCYVVSGTQQQFSRLRADVLPAWKRLTGSDTPPREVYVGGHSAGGAAAQIASLYCKKVWPSAKVAVINIASLFTGNAPFAAYIKKVLGSTPLGFTMNEDIFGDQLPINWPLQLWARSEKLNFIKTNWIGLQSTCYAVPRPPGIYISLPDHFPFNYVYGIENCILHQT